MSRPLTSYLKVGQLWTDGEIELQQSISIDQQLMEAVEEFAWANGCIVVKREYSEDNDAARRDRARGYVALTTPEMATPIPRSGPVPFGQEKWGTNCDFPNVSYVRQTAEFTCGPAALSMGLSALGLIDRPSRGLEIDIWREATLGGYHRGCDSYGLAVASNRRGAPTDVWLSTLEPIGLEDTSSDAERELKIFAQHEQLELLEKSSSKRIYEWFDLEDLKEVILAGNLAIVLIDELLMHGKPCPHWILVHTIHNGHFIVHDPWTDSDIQESWLDSFNLPLSLESIDAIARWGNPEYRSMLVLPRRSPCVTSKDSRDQREPRDEIQSDIS
jgi:predicted double-glycine peptidase